MHARIFVLLSRVHASSSISPLGLGGGAPRLGRAPPAGWSGCKSKCDG
jgi:hypothetical protein